MRFMHDQMLYGIVGLFLYKNAIQHQKYYERKKNNAKTTDILCTRKIVHMQEYE